MNIKSIYDWIPEIAEAYYKAYPHLRPFNGGDRAKLYSAETAADFAKRKWTEQAIADRSGSDKRLIGTAHYHNSISSTNYKAKRRSKRTSINGNEFKSREHSRNASVPKEMHMEQGSTTEAAVLDLFR